MPLQDYQVGSNDLTSAMFQRRFEPNFAWGNAIGGLQMLLNLRGLWPMSSVNESGNVYDLSGQGRTLTNTGTATFAQAGLAPYVSLDGATQYLSRADEAGLDITGALTLGGWFYSTDITSSPAPVSKWTAAGDQRAYAISWLSTGVARAAISSLGTAATVITCDSAAASVVEDAWHFCAMRFNPSTELAVWVNRLKWTNVTSIPAALFNSSAAIFVGGINAVAYFPGRVSLAWLCAGLLNDATIRTIYEQQRALFGVGFEV